MENDLPAGGVSEEESDGSAEQPSLKWTPLPPPNIKYNLWNAVSMFRDDEVEETNTANEHFGSDSFEKFGDGMHSSHFVKESHMEIDTAVNVQPPNEDQKVFSDEDDFLDMSIEDERVFDKIMQEDMDFDTLSSQETTIHTKNTFVALEPSNRTIPSCTSHTSQNDNPTNNDEASLTSYNPPVDIYDIDNEFDEISVDELNRIDREVDIYIERSPDSSSSDELPPVRWDKSTDPVVKPSQVHHISKANWLPVVQQPGADLNPVVCRKSYSNVKKVEVRGENSGTSIRQVSPVTSQGVPTLQPAVPAAVSFGPSVSNSTTAITSHLAVKQCPMCYFEFPARYVVNKCIL